MYWLMNLQLFADPADPKVPPVDVEEEPESDEEEELDEEPAEEELDDEPEEEPAEVKPPKDKKTAAIIREKEKNKALKERLAELERKEAEREREKADNVYRKSLSDKGFSDEEVEEKIELRRRLDRQEAEIKRQRYERQAEKLSSKYPEVEEHLDEFIKISEKSGLTLEEVCKAKLGSLTEHEIRTKAEQEALLNSQKAKSKKTVVGEQKSTQGIKFSAADEEAYQFYAKRNPGTSRKAYSAILKAKRG